jgi:hypothetical protein
MISNSYKKIMWGVLISGFHINVSIGIGVLQLIPAFIGYFILYQGITELINNAGFSYMEKVKKDTRLLIIFSIVLWCIGFLFGYMGVIVKGLMVLFYLFEILIYGDILSKTAKYYKENNRIEEETLLRKKRIKFLKFYLFVIALHIVYMLPEGIGGNFTKIFIPVIEYLCITFMVIAKIWFSMIVQRLTWENN